MHAFGVHRLGLYAKWNEASLRDLGDNFDRAP
jgi:hypothetical protein